MSNFDEHQAEQAEITVMCEAGECDHPECIKERHRANLEPFDPELFDIVRKRFSTTQGEVLLKYDGTNLGQFEDGMSLGTDGNYYGRSDDHWCDLAEMIAIDMDLAVPPPLEGNPRWNSQQIDGINDKSKAALDELIQKLDELSEAQQRLDKDLRELLDVMKAREAGE